MADEFRFMAKWSSNYNCIGAKINGKTKHIIYK